jgi:hypothetical protein
MSKVARRKKPRKEVTKKEVFAAAYRVAIRNGIRGVTHRAVLEELGRGSFALGPLIEEWKRELKQAGDVPPYLAEAAIRQVTELWQLVKDSMRIEQQLQRHTHLSTKSKSEKVDSTFRVRKKRVPNELKYLVAKAAEEILLKFNRPMFGVEIYDNLPDSLKSKIHRDKMYRILDAAKDSQLVHMSEKFGVKDLRWWISDLALPAEYLKREKKTVYKRVETNFALKRLNLSDLVKRAIEVLIDSGKPLHFDLICQKLHIDNDIKNDFRRSLYRRSIYDKRYKKIRRHTYQAIEGATM